MPNGTYPRVERVLPLSHLLCWDGQTVRPLRRLAPPHCWKYEDNHQKGTRDRGCYEPRWLFERLQSPGYWCRYISFRSARFNILFQNAFWSVANSDPHAALSWDRMHAYHSGLFRKHIWPVLQTAITNLGCEEIRVTDYQYVLIRST